MRGHNMRLEVKADTRKIENVGCAFYETTQIIWGGGGNGSGEKK